MNSPWYRTLTSREQDCLAYNQFVRQSRSKSRRDTAVLLEQARFAILGVNQSITQPATGTLSEDALVCCAILPNSKLYISLDPTYEINKGGVAQHRLLTGVEAMNSQGWPTAHPALSKLVDKTDNAMLMELAGNAYGSTVMIALTLAILSSVDFREESRVNCSSDEYCEDALSLLKKARLL
jgi:hypothetical protein